MDESIQIVKIVSGSRSDFVTPSVLAGLGSQNAYITEDSALFYMTEDGDYYITEES